MLGFSLGQSIVSWLLRKYLGRYIADIDSRVKDFNYGLTGGQLLMKNLDLKAEALVGLDLPIEVKAGHVGYLELKLPGITSIYTESIEVKIDKVVLLASPVCDRKYDAEKDEALELARKRETLDKLEQLLLEQAGGDEGDEDPINDPGFLETIKITVLQNIHVEISNIHIRYEDDVTNPRSPFAFGITLQELSLRPSDRQQDDSSPLSCVNKLLKLKELCIYWNCLLMPKQLLKDKIGDGSKDWKYELYRSIESMDLLGAKLDYLVEPVNGSADLAINIKERSSQPLVSCKGHFDHIVVTFKRHMFLTAIVLKDSFALMRVNEKYRKYHPGVPLRSHCREWWLYAYTSIKQEVIKPKKEFWVRIWQYRTMYKKYRDLYTEKLLSPNAANSQALDELELLLNIESIVMARKEAEKIYLEKEPDMAVEKPANEGIFTRLSNWWYGDSDSQDIVVHAKRSSNSKDDFLTSLSDSDKRDLYKAFNYSKEDSLETTVSSTYVKYAVDFSLEGIQLDLQIDDQYSRSLHVATLFVSNITGHLAMRTQGKKFTINVQHLEVYNSAVPHNRITVARIDHPQSVNPEATDLDRLLTVAVEQYPLDIEADVSIKIRTLPIRLVYNHTVACAVMAFFHLREKSLDIGTRLKNLSPEFSTAGLQYAIDRHKRIYVEADLHSPYLVVPADGVSFSSVRACSKLVIDLGVLRVRTQLRPKSAKLMEGQSLKEQEEVIYDKYMLNIEHVKVLFASKVEWADKRHQKDSNIHIMPSLNLSTTVSLSAEPNFSRLPKFKIDSEIESLRLKVSDSLVETMLKDAYKFPHPSAKEFFVTHSLSSPALPVAGYSSGLVAAGIVGVSAAENLMKSELTQGGGSLFDEVDFTKIARLEEKNIFVSEADLMNLWFLLSKEKKKQQDSTDSGSLGSVTNQKDGLNAVVDLLLQPNDSPDNAESLTLHNYANGELNAEEDEEFVDALDEDPDKRLLLPGLRGYSGTGFHTLVFTNFSIGEVSLKLLSGFQEYLTIAVNDVTGQACRTTCCTSVQVQLRSFTILDNLHLDVNRQNLYIAKSPEAESMATFEGQFIDDVQAIDFSDVSKSMVFTMNSIQLCIQDQSTSQILNRAQKISKLLTVLQKSERPQEPPLEPPIIASRATSLQSVPATVADRDVFYDAQSKFDTTSLLSKRSMSRRSIDCQESRTRPSQQTRRIRRKASRRKVEVVNLHVKCLLQGVSLELQREFNIIAQLDVKGVSGEYKQMNAQWSVSAKLEALSLVDPLAPIYKQVAVVEKGLKEVMTLTFTSFNQSVQANESCDQIVKLVLRRMRVIYVNKFISRLLNFLGEFSSRETVERVHETSRSKISTTAISAHQKGTRMIIFMKAKAPLIVMPENDQSETALLLRLGDLHVTNQFVTEQVPSQNITTEQIFDEMTLNLKNIAIEGITYVNEHTYIKRRDLLTPINTNILVRRALPPVAKSVKDFHIEANINSFTVEVSQLDMQMFGRVIYENVMVSDQKSASYDVTDVGSTISSAISSTTSSSSSSTKALTIHLCLGGANLHLKHEQPSPNLLEAPSESLALLNVSKLNIDFSKGKKDSSIDCNVALSGFTVLDQVPTDQDNGFSTNNVIELEEGDKEVLLVKYNLKSSGDSSVCCSVQGMRFNVNMPFVKSVMTFLKDSFTTWKSAAPAPSLRQPSRHRHRAARRPNRLNTAGVNRQLSVSAKKLSPARPGQITSEHVDSHVTKMSLTLTFGKQSLFLASADGSLKALVAELDIRGSADMISNGSIHASLYLNNLSVFSTSLRSEESHLRHECLKPCSVNIAYESLTPMSRLKLDIPPKVEVTIKLTKMDVKLSTNLIYHTYTALELLQGTDTTDDTAAVNLQTNEVDLNVMKDIDRDDWLRQYVFRYDQADEFQQVEMNPTQAAVECLTVEEFDLDIEFSVAIGDEFVPILRTKSDLSGSMKDWSTRIRAECYFSLESVYYNEVIDVWEPLVEPMFDSKTGKYRRWEILARITSAPSHPIARTDPSEILLDCQELDTFIHHQMSSVKEHQRANLVVPQRAREYNTAVDIDEISGSDVSDVSGVRSAGVVAVTATYHKRSGTVNIPSPIKEEEIVEEVITPTQSLLQSTGPPPAVPTILFTQASRVDMEFDENEDQKVDGVNTPSVCQSVADRDEETGNTTVDEKEATPEVMCTYLSLVSRDRLLLTISPQGLNVVSCIVDTLTKKPTDSTLFEVSKSYALTITNLLGIPACVALHANSRQRGRGIKLENVRLSDHVDVSESSATEQQQSGENTLKSLAKLTSPTSDATRKVFGLSSPPPVTLKRQALHLAVDGYIPIPNILFRRTQSMDFMARPRNQRADSLCIRVKTQTKHGKKLVSIYSQLKIRNEFSCPVQISYSEVSYDETNQQHVPVNKSLGVVEPGAMLYIPAVVAQQKKLHVKPITDAESDSAGDFGESNETLWWRDHLKAKASFRSSSTKRSYVEIFEFLTCTNQLQQTFCFKAVWVGRKCMADNCQGNCPSFDVLLQPPAEIKNFLPFNIKLEVQINSSSLGTRPNTYDLEPGETRHIYDAISTPKRCYLVIPNYLDKSWKGVIDVHDSMSVNRMTDITLVAETDADAEQPNESAEATNQVTVTSHVTRAQSDRCSNGQLQITFFASYWISNTTNKTLQFKAAGIRSRIVETSSPYPILFMPSSLKKKMKLRIPEYKWSKSFAVDAAGMVRGVSCRKVSPSMKQRFMVETKLSNTQLTKIITIFPMFVVLNKCETTLFYQESFVSSPSTPLATEEDDTGIHHLDTDGEDDEVDDGNNGLLPTIRALANLWVKIEPGEAKPFWPTRFGKSLSMVLKTDQSNEVSHTFSASIPQRTLLTWSDQQSAVTAEVSGGLGTEYFITLRPYQLGDAVVRLENLTQYSLLFSQGNTSSGKTLTVPSSKSWLYFWPNPMADRKLFWSVPELKSKHTIAHFSQDFSSQVNCQGQVIYCQSYRDNLQRVLTFSDHESFQQIIHKRNQKEQATLFAFSALDSVRLSLVNSSSLEIALISANQSPSCWSVKLEGTDGESRWYDLGEKLSSVIESAYCNCLTEPVYQNRDIEINFRELAFVRPISGVLKRESFPGIKLQYQKSDLSMALQASVNYLQIDNQLPDAFFRVVFHPLQAGGDSRAPSTRKSCLDLFLRIQFPIDGSAHTIKHSSNIASSRLTTSLKAVVSIERFSLKIDKGFLLSSLDYITNCTKTDTDNYNTVMKRYHEQDVQYCLTDLTSDSLQKTNKSTGTKIYVEDLKVSGLQARLSFSMAGTPHLTDVQHTQSTFGGDVVDFLLRSIGMTLTEVTDIQFKLGELTISCDVLTTDQLSNDALTFYKSQAIRQAYVFLLGLDIIGNPFGLFKDVQRGLYDFFSSADPLNFNENKSLSKGIKSAYGNIVGGLCGAGSKITESIGRGINVLTFDQKFLKVRLRSMRSHPAHFPGTLLLSARTFGKAVTSGLTGVALQPKTGLEKDGAKGFFKGIGKGVTGILIKPLGGVFDSTSIILNGFRRVTQDDTLSVERVRLPRHTLPLEGVSRYHPYKAEGADLLNTMGSYIYTPDNVYWAHLALRGEKKRKRVALATTRDLYMLCKPFYSSNLSTKWCISLTDISSTEYNEGIITITRRSLPDEKKRIESSNIEELKWFHKRLRKLLDYGRVTSEGNV